MKNLHVGYVLSDHYCNIISVVYLNWARLLWA